MSLVLHYHPLASFCWKPLIALYENDTAFEPVMVDLGNPESRAAFEKVWPMAKFPVLVDTDRGATIAESTTIVEYLDTFHPGPVRLLPVDQDGAWQARMWDRVFDHYLQEPMQKIVGDRLRPDGGHDLQGVEQALGGLRQAYAMLEPLLVGRDWFLDEFSLVDCSAAPALLYADAVLPFTASEVNLLGYLNRLKERPSFARVLEEAEPYFDYFPIDRKPSRAPQMVLA